MDLARLLVAQSKEASVAAALAVELPEICQAVIDGAKGRGPTGATDRALLLRLMEHPAAGASSAKAVARAVTATLTQRLEAAASRAQARVLRQGDGARVVASSPADGAGSGHAGGTVPAGPVPKLPF